MTPEYDLPNPLGEKHQGYHLKMKKAKYVREHIGNSKCLVLEDDKEIHLFSLGEIQLLLHTDHTTI